MLLREWYGIETKQVWGYGEVYSSDFVYACLQVLTRGAKVLYESCVDTVHYEEFFKGEYNRTRFNFIALHLALHFSA